MPKLLCLTCLTEEAVPAVGSGSGVPNGDGTKLLCPESCTPEVHTPVEMPLHCGKPMKYFSEDNVDEFRVCPD